MMSKKTIEPVRCKYCKHEGKDAIKRFEYTEPYNPEGIQHKGYYPECDSCGVRGPECDTPEEAVAVWNDMNRDWTPASEPPKKSGLYLVSYKIATGNIISGIDWFSSTDDGSGYWDRPNKDYLHSILAWQPLLDPYEPEKEAGE